MIDIPTSLSFEAKRVEEDSEFSAKSHYNAAARWAHYHLWVGLPSALIAAIAGAAAFKNQPELAGSLALVSTALTTVLTFLKPSERSEIHKTAAGQYHALRNRTRIYRHIELAHSADAQAAQATLIELAKVRDELNQSAPGIARCDYEQARKDIEAGHSRYRMDEVQK